MTLYSIQSQLCIEYRVIKTEHLWNLEFEKAFFSNIKKCVRVKSDTLNFLEWEKKNENLELSASDFNRTHLKLPNLHIVQWCSFPFIQLELEEWLVVCSWTASKGLKFIYWSCTSTFALQAVSSTDKFPHKNQQGKQWRQKWTRLSLSQIQLPSSPRLKTGT